MDQDDRDRLELGGGAVRRYVVDVDVAARVVTVGPRADLDAAGADVVDMVWAAGPVRRSSWPLRFRFGRRPFPKRLIPFRPRFARRSSVKSMKWAHDWGIFRTSGSRGARNSSCG